MSAPKIYWPGEKVTREGRACNLFGLESCRYTRKYGQTGEDNARGDHLAILPNFESGYHAAIDLIRDHYLTLGCFVPYYFGNKWSGDPQKIYGVTLSEIMKVNAYRPLRFNAAGDVLLRAVAIDENGDPCRVIPPGFFNQFINEDL